MKVEVKSLTESAIEERDYRDALEISIDGKVKFSVSDGEPEDANLSRDFSGCYSVGEMIVAAHEAGSRGEELDINYIEVDEI